MFNSKGQASSVFNLLIAGIVAVAILGILLYLIDIPRFTTDPNKMAQNIVSQGYSNKFNYNRTSESANFDNSVSISSRGVVEGVKALIPKQVCLLPGKYTNYFEAPTDGMLLKYTSPSPQDLRLASYCGSAGTSAEGDLVSEVNRIVGENTWVQQQVSACACMVDSSLNDDICCVVFPVKN